MLKVSGGHLEGGVRIQGWAGAIQVLGGNIGVAGDGGVGDVSVMGGGLRRLYVKDGDVTAGGTGARVSAVGDIGSAIVVGAIAGNIETSAGGDLGVLLSKGPLSGSVSVSGAADRVLALGGVSGSATIGVQNDIGVFMTRGPMAGSLDVAGDSGTVLVRGGDLLGALNVDGAMGSLSVLNGSIADSGPEEADVNVGGPLGRLYVSGGGLRGTVMAGRLGSVSVSDQAGLGGEVLSDSGINILVTSGKLHGTVEAAGHIGRVSVGEGFRGRIQARSLGSVSVGGDVNGASLSAWGGPLNVVSVRGNMLDSEVSVTGTLSRAMVHGNYASSTLQAVRIGSAHIGGEISGEAPAEIRAEQGWFRFYRDGSSWLIADSSGYRFDQFHAYIDV
jgi:hypothetical protein